MEKWSLTRGLDDSELTGGNLVLWKSGRLGDMVAHQGLTVFILWQASGTFRFPSCHDITNFCADLNFVIFAIVKGLRRLIPQKENVRVALICP